MLDDAHARVHRAWWWAGLCLCIAMLGIHVASGFNEPGVSDTWRDLWWATAIAHGERWPLAGPPIYGMLELGPWWFYLLAVPMLVSHSAAVTCAFVQALAALKYFIAWRLGMRIADARLGFAFAASLVIAGWSIVPWLFASHTALVETLLLTLAYATLACWQRFSWRQALLFGLVAAACIHAHPTTSSYIALGGAAILWRHRSRAGIACMLLAVGVVLLSLAPPWLQHAEAGITGLKPVANWLDHDVAVHPLARVGALLQGLVLGGPRWAWPLATHWNAETLALAEWIYLACLAFGLAGLLLLPRRATRCRRAATLAAVLLAAQVPFLILLRPVTPMWMVPSCLPPLALLIGLGWHGWLRRTRAWQRAFATCAMGVFVILSLVPFAIEFQVPREVRMPSASNPLADAGARPAAFAAERVAFYPVRSLDALAPALCAPAVLHGPLASVVETAWASPLRNACGEWPQVVYGGVQGPPRHVAGVFDWMAEALPLSAAQTSAHMALYDDVRAIAPPQGGARVAPRRREISPPSGSLPLLPLEYAFSANCDDVVLLTNRLPAAAPMAVRAVRADSQALQPLVTDGSAFAFHAGDCIPGAVLQWSVAVTAIQANIDLVVLASKPRAQ